MLQNMDKHHIIKDAEKKWKAQRQLSGNDQQDQDQQEQDQQIDRHTLLKQYLEQQQQLFEQQRHVSERLQEISQKISDLTSNMN